MISAAICRCFFGASVICHVFMHCFGSFQLQAMFLSLQIFTFKGQNMKLTVNMLFTCILHCEWLFAASVWQGLPDLPTLAVTKLTNQSQAILIVFLRSKDFK